jgi:hypothetical protein
MGLKTLEGYPDPIKGLFFTTIAPTIHHTKYTYKYAQTITRPTRTGTSTYEFFIINKVFSYGGTAHKFYHSNQINRGL